MIIKEFCPQANRAVIREDLYGSKWGKFESLLRVAVGDYPELSISDVEIVHFAGGRYAHTFGIEFPAEFQADGYKEISMLEYTY